MLMNTHRNVCNTSPATLHRISQLRNHLACAHVTQQQQRTMVAAAVANNGIGAGHPLLAAFEKGSQRFVSPEHVHVVSHCKVSKDKAAEFWSLAQELIPNCRVEPHQVYQHVLRARPDFGRDPETEFVWLEEWEKPEGFEYHASGTPYNSHFHSIVDEYTDEVCTVYSGPGGMQLLPEQSYMRSYEPAAIADRKEHVFVVSHVHVFPEKLDEFLVKAATLLPHCRAELGCVYENLYQNTACGPCIDADPYSFVWMEEWESEGHFAAHLTSPHVAAFWESAKDIYDRKEQIHTFYGPEF